MNIVFISIYAFLFFVLGVLSTYNSLLFIRLKKDYDVSKSSNMFEFIKECDDYRCVKARKISLAVKAVISIIIIMTVWILCGF